MGSSSACLCIWPTEESIFHWTERRSSLTARPGRCSPSIPLQHHVGILKKKKIFVFDSRGDVHVTRVSEWVFVKHSWCCRCRWVFMACNLTVNHTGRDEGQRTQASSLTRRTWTIFNRNVRGNLIHIRRMFESGVEKKTNTRLGGWFGDDSADCLHVETPMTASNWTFTMDLTCPLILKDKS